MVAIASKMGGSKKGRTVGRKRKPMPKEIRRTLAGRFGLRLETLVFERGLTVKEFADKIGKSEDAVRTYFKGRLPQIGDLPLMARVLGLNDYREIFPE